jgi:hypothetical protein
MWASLQSQFFSDHPPGREFFERHLGAFPWSQQVLPVYEWENQVFVAAVNPAEISGMLTEWPAHWVLVQADAGALRDLWQSWNGAENEVANSNPLASKPRSISSKDEATQPRIAFEMNEDTTPPVQMPPLPSDVEVRTPQVKAAAAGFTAPVETKAKDFNPDDFFSSIEASASAVPAVAAEVELDLASGFPDVESSEKSGDEDPAVDGDKSAEEPATVEGLDMPEGLNAGASPPAAPADDFSTFSGLSNATNSSASITTSRPNVPIPNFKSPVVPIAGPSRTDIPVPTSNTATAKLGQPPPKTAASTDSPAVAAQPEKTASKPALKPVVAAQAPSAEAAPEMKTTFHGLEISGHTRALLTQLPEVYSKAFLATKAGNSLRIVTWPTTHTKGQDAEFDFSLGTPSPFRIVLRTEKPYHGHVIHSPYLDGFFQSWNGGQYPEVLTVVPLHLTGNTLGFVIAFGNGAAIGKAGLNAIDKLSQDLLRDWPAVPSSQTG